MLLVLPKETRDSSSDAETSASSSNLSEEDLILKDLDETALNLDSGDARISKHQAAIDDLEQETRQSLADLAEVVEKL